MKDIHEIYYQMSHQDIEQFLFILAQMGNVTFYLVDNSNTCKTFTFDEEVPVCPNGPFIQINIKQD